MKSHYLKIELVNGEFRTIEIKHEELITPLKTSLLKGDAKWLNNGEVYINLANVISVRFVEVEEQQQQTMTEEEFEAWI